MPNDYEIACALEAHYNLIRDHYDHQCQDGDDPEYQSSEEYDEGEDYN